MKFLLMFLIVPVFSFGQTVHIKDEKIVYEGAETVAGVSSEEIFARVQKTLPGIVNGYTVDTVSGNSIKAKGQMKLATPYPIIRTVSYSIGVKATEKGYEYKIDDVFFTQKERGGKEVVMPSSAVVEGIEETGKVVGETEKILNETDMRFQKILALLRSAVRKS